MGVKATHRGCGCFHWLLYDVCWTCNIEVSRSSSYSSGESGLRGRQLDAHRIADTLTVATTVATSALEIVMTATILIVVVTVTVPPFAVTVDDISRYIVLYDVATAETTTLRN